MGDFFFDKKIIHIYDLYLLQILISIYIYEYKFFFWDLLIFWSWDYYYENVNFTCVFHSFIYLHLFLIILYYYLVLYLHFFSYLFFEVLNNNMRHECIILIYVNITGVDCFLIVSMEKKYHYWLIFPIYFCSLDTFVKFGPLMWFVVVGLENWSSEWCSFSQHA